MKKNYLLCCKLALTLFFLFAISNVFSQSQIYNSSGSFTVPAGVTSITIEAWGGGGKGGSRTTNGTGGGGGGGAYAKSTLTVTPLSTHTVTVGIGSSSTSAGGDSWFGTATSVLAKGGQSVSDDQTTGVAGGLASASIGTTKYDGGFGANGSTSAGGGGSSAGNAVNGNTSTSSTGATAPLGGGNGGNGATSNGNGSNGLEPGGGGGGATRTTGTVVLAGGNGGNGRIIISYTLPNGPGGVITALQLWLRADLLNGSTSISDNTNVTFWQTQGGGSNAVVANAGQEPKFRNTPTFNANFNAVVNFVNTPFATDTPGTALPQQYLKGDFGYFTQEMFVVIIPDNAILSTTSSTAVFSGDSNPNVEGDNDISGIGLGSCTARFDEETISYLISSTPSASSTPISERGFGVAETSNTKSYQSKSVGFVNARNIDISVPNTQELLYNANAIGNTTVGLPQFKNFNSRYWIARNQDRKAAFNGNIAEIITYDSRKNDASERNRIESYLGIKYGITLGTNGTSQNYVNSDGNIIWNTTTNSGFNWNIAGIGRDDISKLTQKQSRSSNSADEVAIGLGEVSTTNTANPNTFSINKQYLVWGSNNATLTATGAATTSVTLGSGVTTTFIGSQRKYKIVETGGDVAQTVVSLPKTALAAFTKTATQEYVLIVSSTANFASADIIDIIPMTDSGTNFETWYDFDATKFFSFGVANVSTIKYRADNNTGDFIVGEKDINLSTSFTVSAWIRTTANNGTFIAKNGAYQFYVNASGKVVGNWNNGNRIVSNTTITTGKYHYVAITFSSGTAKLYIDGVLDVTATSQPTPISNTNNFSIGAIWASKSAITSTFIGDIDEVRIWNSELTDTQLRFIMNQEILKSTTNTFGSVIPNSITKNDISTLPWNNLQAYFDMNTLYGTSIKDLSDNNRWARIKYLVTDNIMIEGQTAPLPYVSTATGSWQNTATWSNGAVQNIANSPSLVNSSINVDWNIVQTQNAVTSNGNKIVLGLLVSSNTLSATNDTKIEVSHYLKLDGKIDLVDESQLIQTLNSDLDPTSAGSLEKDQQGTKDIYNYNFWCSPVGAINNTTNNNSHTVNGVFKDGTTSTPTNINWIGGYDGAPASPISLASYWIFKFQSASANYANWMSVGPNGTLTTAQGFTLKGSGASTTNQNYTFLGKPNNGLIQFSMGPNLINLTGNPYASALDAKAFINANSTSTDGTLYFWDHFGGGTHILLDYQGGYATYNILGGVVAMSHPTLQNVGPGTKQPKDYVPVGQGFFIRSSASGGNIVFNNNQRFFAKKDGTNSIMFKNSNQISNIPETDHFTNNSEDVAEEQEPLMKIRLGYKTKDDFKRQVLLGFANENATSDIDTGYDAIHIDYQTNDMYFMHGETKLIIQGDGFFNILNSYPIGVKSSGEGTVKFMIDEIENFDSNQQVYIYDNLTEMYHSIKTEEFQISIPEGTFEDRFSLRFTNGENLGVENPTALNGIHVAFTSNNNILHIKNELTDTKVISATVFNILGQKLTTYNIENQTQEAIQIPISNLSTGTYIVKIQTTNGNLSTKIIIR